MIASALAAVVAGLEAGRKPPPAEGGNLYGDGHAAARVARRGRRAGHADDTILEILGADSVLDFAAIARSEWPEYSNACQRLGAPALPGTFVSAPRFGVWAPVYGNHGARHHPDDAPDASYRRTRDLLLRAEQAGFDSTLLAQHVIHPSDVEDDVLETWSTLAALAEATSRIELIGAIKPLLFNPLVFAKLAANIAEIADGRLAINVVSGWFLPELEALGLDAARPRRPLRLHAGWLETVRSCGQASRSTIGDSGGHRRWCGRYRADVAAASTSAASPSRPARWPHEHGDVFFINGRPLDDTSTSSTTCAPAHATATRCDSACPRS